MTTPPKELTWLDGTPLTQKEFITICRWFDERIYTLEKEIGPEWEKLLKELKIT